MRAREVVRGKPARIEKRNGERVAQREGGGGAGRGCEVERARLLRDARVEMDVRLARER